MLNFPAARRKLRVAMVTETYPPEINGAAMTVSRIAEGLQGRGHTVQLVRPRQSPSEQPVHTPLFEEVLKPGLPIPRHNSLKIGLPAKQALIRLWAAHRPDIVHVFTEGPLGWSALAAAEKLRLPVVTNFHTNYHRRSEQYGFGWLKNPITAYLRNFHNKAQRTFVPTSTLQDELSDLGLRNLQVVARGVDTRLFNPARRSIALRRSWGAGPNDLVVMYVGRLAAEKNLPDVFRAYSMMRVVQPSAKLVLVGDGPERARLAQEFPQAIFSGIRVREHLATQYASADIFLFPSITETYGNVTVEAMASGLAVIAYDCAAAKQHIRHNINGLLAPFDATDDFVKLATALAPDTSRIRAMGAAARASAEKMDCKSATVDYEQALLVLSTDQTEPLFPANAIA